MCKPAPELHGPAQDHFAEDDGCAALLQLQALELAHTEVTDADLEHLAGLTQLRSLKLYDSHVTESDVQKLKQTLPRCSVHPYGHAR